MLEDLVAKHRHEHEERAAELTALEDALRSSVSRYLVLFKTFSAESGWIITDRGLCTHYPYGAGESKPLTALLIELSPPSHGYSLPYLRFATWLEPKLFGGSATLRCKAEILPEDPTGWWAVERLHYWRDNSEEKLTSVLRHVYDRLRTR